jgi:cyanate permease
MERSSLANKKVIIALMFLQLVPLILFPPSVFSLDSQEWWLPVLLMIMAIVGLVQLVFLHNHEPNPWYLINFAQGFNLISRLLMLFPHITTNDNGNQVFNTAYVILTVISMAFSAFLISYFERADVRLELLRD